jgi:hypothetical protein
LNDGQYQLREQDQQGNDTGALRHMDSLDAAFQEFITGKYWKLSFVLPNGQRLRLLWEPGRFADSDIGVIRVTDPRKMAEEVEKEIQEKS